MIPSVIIGIAIAAIFSIAILLVPASQRVAVTPWFAVGAALAYYWRDFAGFALMAALAYAAVLWILGEPVPDRRWNRACFVMFVLLGVFTAGRVWSWERAFRVPGIGPISLWSLGMWPALRLVTLFWEVGSGTVPPPSPVGYITWMCLPFTLGGPILRWSEAPCCIQPDAHPLRSAAWWRAAAAATAKLAAGLYLGLGQQFLITHWAHSRALDKGLSTFVSGPLGFYLITAGYFDWMQLTGRLAGWNLPESFHYPIGRENISAFWMNWNMTATYVFRDYLFYNRWGRESFNVYLNTILLFTLVGLWHAANAYWILWGFLHGLLFSGFLLWRKYRGKFELPFSGTPAARMAARVFTYACVCLCWYLPSKILQKVTGTFS